MRLGYASPNWAMGIPVLFQDYPWWVKGIIVLSFISIIYILWKFVHEG